MIRLIILVVVLIACVLVVWIATKPRSSAKEKHLVEQVQKLDEALDELRELAYDFRETDAGLSYEVIDKVKEIKKSITYP